MTKPAKRLRGVIAIALAATLALGVVTGPSASAGTGYRAKILRLVNASRRAHDLRTLRIDRSLNRDAMRHTRRMIEKNFLYDPRNLARMLVDEPWDDAGASIIGCARSLFTLHRAFMRHAAHRVILLDPRLRRIGIGGINVGSRNACGRGWWWMTEVFYG